VREKVRGKWAAVRIGSDRVHHHPVSDSITKLLLLEDVSA